MDLDDQLKRIFDAALRDLTALAHDAQGRARREATDDARAEGRELTSRLLDAFRAMDRARTLTEILDTLVGCAARETARAGVLLVRDGRAKGWQFLGFEPAFDNGASLDIDLQSPDAGIIADAVQTRAVARHDAGDAPAFARLTSDRPCLAIPIALRHDVVGVLYADRGMSDHTRGPAPDELWADALEILVRHAEKSLEALTAIKAARAFAGAEGEAPASFALQT